MDFDVVQFRLVVGCNVQIRERTWDLSECYFFARGVRDIGGLGGLFHDGEISDPFDIKWG